MSILDFRKTKQEMNNGRFHQGYLFYGEEKYLIQQLVQQIINRFVAEEMRDIDLIRLKFDKLIETAQIDRIKQEMQTPAFLSERKIILLENPGIFQKAEKGNSEHHKEMIAQFEMIFALLNPYSCFIVLEESVDNRRKKLLDKWLAADGSIVEVKKEDLHILCQWVQALAQKKNLGITKQAAESLIDRCDAEMIQIEKELSKVLLFAEYLQAGGVDLEMIDNVCRADLRGNIFDLTDAVSAGNTKRALTIFETLIAQKEPLPLIRYMLTRHIKQLICAKELQNEKNLSQTLKIYPSIAGRLLKQTAHLNIEQLEYLFRLAFLSDWKVKKGLMNDRLSFETLLIESCLAFKR